MSKKDASLAPVPPSAMTILLSPVAGVVMFVFLLAGLLSCLWAMFVSGKVDLLPKEHGWAAISEGEITHHIAKELSHVTLARKAADLERAASWLLIGDTGARVRQGCPGWLFLADENRIHPRAEANAQARAQKVLAVRDWLAARNIRLLVALVPDKSRIAASQRCALQRPAPLQDRVTVWTARLQAAGINALDLTPSLQPLGADAFLRTDTHWSESGANAAARAIALRVQAAGIQATPHTPFDVHSTPMAPRPGDLVRLAGIDWLPLSLQPAPESVAATEIREQMKTAQGNSDNLDDLFGDDNLPNVALIGTSFSRNSSFAGFLQRALGAPVGNFAKDGGEFSGAANAYFASPAFSQTPPRLVIWEIPERDLQTVYGQEIKGEM